MISAVIIDDQEEARFTLEDDLREYGEGIAVIGQAGSVKAGIRLINSLKPDVIFLDIHLEDGTGFMILEGITPYPYQVIFTTGSDSFAFRAIKFSALDYLLKPIDPDELAAAIRKIREKPKAALPQENIELLIENLKHKNEKPKRIALGSADRIHMVEVKDIIRCESQRNYTLFHLGGNRQLLVTRTLKEFDEMLERYGFYRVHHSHLINLDYLREFVKADGGYAVMSDGSKVPVAVRKKDELLSILGIH
jgi:two-component system LytT family response regulator